MTGIPYPWKTYTGMLPVQDFLYGAMENTAATVFGDFILVDKREFIDRNYIGTNVHELTHQWFGDYITARSSKHTWLGILCNLLSEKISKKYLWRRLLSMAAEGRT